jgi:hypothetical protein
MNEANHLIKIIAIKIIAVKIVTIYIVKYEEKVANLNDPLGINFSNRILEN